MKLYVTNVKRNLINHYNINKLSTQNVYHVNQDSRIFKSLSMPLFYFFSSICVQIGQPVNDLLSSMLLLWHLIVMLLIYQLISRTLYNIPIGAKYFQSEMIMLYKYTE